MIKVERARLTLAATFVVLMSAQAAACSSDAADRLGVRTGRGAGGASEQQNAGTVTGTPGVPGPDGRTPEERLFRGLEQDIQKKCGGTCHTDGTYRPEPPLFLEGDAYKSIKAYPGIVVADTFQSSLLTKGPHAGPSVAADPEFEKAIIAWLNAEALVLQSQAKPTTDPFAVTAGPNDLDLSKACIGGLVGVRLKFDAGLVAGILSLTNMKIVAPAGSDVHVLKPRFIRIAPDAGKTKEIPDPAHTFETTDQTIPGGQEAALATGAALFSGSSWVPFDLAADKLRIEIDKLEPGKVSVLEKPKTCKDPAGFVANVLPSMRGQAGGFNLNCSSCHGVGLAGMSLNDGDTTLVCNQVLGKLNEANIAQSLIVTKVTTGPHSGGTINNAAAWQQLFTNNAGVFF